MASLQYPPDWKFEPPAIELPMQAHYEFLTLVGKIAVGQSASLVFETFKEYFGVTSSSSNISWAEEDMGRAMSGNLGDAVGYVARFWSAIDELRERELPIPSPRVLNTILRKYDVPLVIEPPVLRLAGADAVLLAEAPPASDIPARADRLIRGKKIGEGGFGTVYEATRTTSVTTFEYALKLLDPSPFLEDRDKAAARFARESKILQRLQHRAIVPYIETGMVDIHQAYILMPLISGTTLRETPMDFGQVLWTFREIIGGLIYLHGRQVIHRDLKPSNIMVRASDYQPLILDFGCAYLFDDVPEKTLTTAHLGSAGYVPPEVLANPTLRDPRQDVYACGVMLYELLRGHRPVADDYAPLAAIIAGSASIDRLVLDAIAPFPRRLSSAREFLDRLAAVAATGDVNRS